MPTAFELAHAFTAKWEGGYVNHPSDPGGATNFGISLRFLEAQGLDIDGDGKVDEKDVRALTPQTAATIYQEHFWARPGLDRLPLLVAIAVYDAGVNLGVMRAVKHLQECSCALDREPLAIDGKLGPRTVARVEALCADMTGQLKFCTKLMDRRAAYYNAIADKNPSLDVFRKGWMRRTLALWDYIYGLVHAGAV